MAETRIDGPRGGESRTGKAMAQSMSSAIRAGAPFSRVIPPAVDI